VTNDEMLIATHNHKKRIRQNKKDNKWYVQYKDMLRVGKFDWFVESGPHSTKLDAMMTLCTCEDTPDGRLYCPTHSNFF